MNHVDRTIISWSYQIWVNQLLAVARASYPVRDRQITINSLPWTWA